jgi:HSP20 family protein
MSIATGAVVTVTQLREDDVMTTSMTPWRRSFGVLEPFRHEMEDLMGRFFGEENGNGRAMKTWAPQVDMEETEKEILVKADLPGIDPKAIEISIENGILTVRGEKKEEKEEKKKNYHRIERFSGMFYRQISLPAGVDADKVSATSANGVVTITVPKKAEAQPKRIAVTAKN